MIYQNVLGIITARGGSKRLPGKNLMKLNGKSLIQIACEQAKSVIKFTVLTTDNGEMMQEAVRCGVKPMLRPQELSTDEATSADVVKHVLAEYPFFEWFCLLQPTSPLRSVDDIKNCIDLATKSGCPVYSTYKAQPNGAVYVCKSAGFEDKDFTRGIEYEMSENRSVDINTAEDFEKAVRFSQSEQICFADGSVQFRG